VYYPRDISTPEDSLDYIELGRRVASVRQHLTAARVRLPVGSPFLEALTEADELARGIKSAKPPTDENVEDTILQASVIWNLAEILDRCAAAGLNPSSHLRNMNSGTLDFGRPAVGPNGNRQIYFKDFEFELLIASLLAQRARSIAFPVAANDPRYDVVADGIWVSVKHPNSTGQMERYLSDFQRELSRGTEHGIFAIALEDVANMANSADEAQKKETLAILCDRLFEAAWRRSRILGVAVTSSALVVDAASDTAKFDRRGNAVVFRREAGSSARNLLGAFCPVPRLWLDETEFREQVAIRSYFHFENKTGKSWHDALANWVQAEEEENATLA